MYMYMIKHWFHTLICLILKMKMQLRLTPINHTKPMTIVYCLGPLVYDPTLVCLSKCL